MSKLSMDDLGRTIEDGKRIRSNVEKPAIVRISLNENKRKGINKKRKLLRVDAGVLAWLFLCVDSHLST